MKIQAVSVTLDRDNDAREGGWVGGNFLKHLLESLPGRFAEQAEFLRDRTVVSSNTMFDFQGTGSSQGDAISVHYDTKDLWILNNTIYDAGPAKTTNYSSGIKLGQTYWTQPANPCVVMGNLIYSSNQGIQVTGLGPKSLLNNTIVDCNGGIRDESGSSAFRDYRGNIVDTIKLPDDPYHHHLFNNTDI